MSNVVILSFESNDTEMEDGSKRLLQYLSEGAEIISQSATATHFMYVLRVSGRVWGTTINTR